MLPDVLSCSSPEAISVLSHATAVRFGVVPRSIVGKELLVDASSDEPELAERLKALTGMPVRLQYASPAVIRKRIAAAYAREERDDIDATLSPIVRLVDTIHDAAASAGASDIHIEPTGAGGCVRIRVDGMLRELRRVSQEELSPVVSRIKILASMDISERRLPQDGSYALSLAGRQFDARVSSLPTVFGERLVIRLLDLHATIPRLESLGMTPALLDTFRRAVCAPSGFVLVCGPTGSGKTTTLYASLAERNTAEENICTIEDPVEVRMPGITQVQINLKAGVTFASSLRSFVRQDPNVVMLGELRDAESAQAAIAASLAGQLVVTTLHATDAASVVERLSELGVDRRSVAAALTAVLSQRLVRRLCSECRQRAVTAKARTDCARCGGSGYAGRAAAFELIMVDDAMRDAIAGGRAVWELRALARASGSRSLRDAAVDLVAQGVTSEDEIARVIPGSVTHA